MKAMLCHEWGEPDILKMGDVPAPKPGPGEVRIRVKACGINFADTLQVAGKYQVKPPFPFSPGLEVSGEIAELGEGVTQPLKVGRRVMAFLRRGGGYAEEAVAHADAVIPIPDTIDDVTAGGFPTIYGTSNFALKYRGKLKAGETLVVLGAAGGVGLTAVEIGKQMGATVIACAGGPEKCALTLNYGADHAIDYKTESIRDRVRQITGGVGADVVYDAVGGDAFDQAIRAVNWEARMLIVGFASGRIQQVPANLILVKNIAVTGVVFGAQTERDPAFGNSFITEMLEWHAQGRVKPLISKTFPLAEAGEGMKALLSRQNAGKIVLTV